MKDGQPTAAEFDEYSAEYEGGMEQPLKRALGRSLDVFARQKIRWMLRDLGRFPLRTASATPRLLDYGCGTGLTLQLLEEAGFAGELEGCDVSGGMLQQAARRWPSGAGPRLRHLTDDDALASASYDIVWCAAVLHHVERSGRCALFATFARILKPGGRLYVFEHNPLNPLTRFIVSRTPIDRNAHLLSANAVQCGMRAAGLRPERTSYFLFFPPRVPLVDTLERPLSWLPVGGQYMAVGYR